MGLLIVASSEAEQFLAPLNYFTIFSKNHRFSQTLNVFLLNLRFFAEIRNFPFIFFPKRLRNSMQISRRSGSEISVCPMCRYPF